MDRPNRFSLLGAFVDAITATDMLTFMAEQIAKRKRTIIANHNLHSLRLYKDRPVMRALFEVADVVEFDSVPMILWSRLLGDPVSMKHRSTYLDYRQSFWNLVQTNGWRVYHLGGKPEVAPKAYAALTKSFPKIDLHVHHGYFDKTSKANDQVLADIAEKAPDVLLVGMGMPLQEEWVFQNLNKLPHCVILTVGGAFDYEAGVTFTPPRWAGRMGLEWLARLISDPMRLYHRYLIEPWALAPLAVKDVLFLNPPAKGLALPEFPVEKRLALLNMALLKQSDG